MISPADESGGTRYVVDPASGSVAMNNCKTVEVIWTTQYYLTTSISPAEGGNVTPVPPGAWYDSGTPVSVSATANSAYVFENWSGDLSGTTTPVSVTMDGLKDVTADFRIVPPTTATVSLPGEVEGTSGSTVAIPIKVTATEQIGIAQFVVEYSSEVLRFDGAVIGSDALGFLVSNTNPDLPFSPTTSGTDENVLVQISGGGAESFTGASQEVVILNFTVVGSAGTASPLAFDQGTTKTNLSTTDLQTLSGSNLTFQDGNFTVAPTPGITIATNPSGRTITVDGTAYTAPQTFTDWSVGSQHTIEVASPQGDACTQYVFTSWSDGGAASHTITVPSSATTYTADFKTQHYLTVNSSRGNPQGASWYDSGTTANWSVTSLSDESAGTRYVADPASGSVVMDDCKTVEVTWTTQYYLTTSISPAEGGSITPAPPGGWYDSGTSVTVSATDNSGYVFANWSGDLSGTTTPASLAMDHAKTVTASFNPEITITTSPSGQTITVDGEDYTAPKTFPDWSTGSQHTIEVGSPQSSGIGKQYVFSSWSDGGAQSHSITIPSTLTTYTANLTTEYYLSTTVIPQDKGTIELSPFGSWYNVGTSVSVTVVPANPDFPFAGWSADLSGTVPSQSITMDGPKYVTASFTPTVTINTSPPGLMVTVDGTPYTAPKTFTTWDIGSEHTIAVTSPQEEAGTRYIFSSWSDGGAQSHTITTPSSVVTYIADFTTQYHLTTIADPSDGGVVTPESGWYGSGTSVNVGATPNINYVFSGWSGDLSGTTTPASFMMDGPKSIIADFGIMPSTPTAEFSANPTSGNSPLTVQFTSTSTGAITTYSWNFGDGGTSTAQNPSHTYQNAGTYTVALTVTGPGGTDTETKTGLITMTAPSPPPSPPPWPPPSPPPPPPQPVASFDVTPNDRRGAVRATEFTFTDKSRAEGGEIVTWEWWKES